MISLQNLIKNQNGLSLVEALVAMGIMGIMTLAFSSMIVNQNKEVKSVGEILAAQDLQKTLSIALSDHNLCDFLLNDPTPIVFNSTRLPFKISLNKPIYSGYTSATPPVLGPVVAEIGKSVSPYAASLVVNSIQFEILSGTGDNYVGRWTVDFDKSKSVRSHRPAYVTTLIKVDDTIPTAAVVLNCNGVVDSKLSSKACPTGQVLSGFTSDGEVNCLNPFTGGSCAADEVVSGINSDGTVNCKKSLSGGSCATGKYVTGISPAGMPTCEDLPIASEDCVGAFDSCSQTCGSGVQVFRILRPKIGSGASCAYADGFSQACNTHSCTKTGTGTSAVCVDHYTEYQFRKNGSNIELLQWGRGRDTGAIGHNCGGAGPSVVWSQPLTNSTATPQVSLTGNSSGSGCTSANISFSGYGVYRSNSTCGARGAQTIRSNFTITYTD